jgi:uncharacterized protein (UPF0305 family)
MSKSNPNRAELIVMLKELGYEQAMETNHAEKTFDSTLINKEIKDLIAEIKDLKVNSESDKDESDTQESDKEEVKKEAKKVSEVKKEASLEVDSLDQEITIVKSYEVQSNLKRNGKIFKKGDKVNLSGKEAKDLLTAKVVK